MSRVRTPSPAFYSDQFCRTPARGEVNQHDRIVTANDLGIICQSCGIEAPSKHAEFHPNIGALVMRFHRSVRGKICKDCAHKHFWSMTGATGAIGWLGVISVIIAPIFLINTLFRYLAVLGMPPVPPVPPGAKAPVLTGDVADALAPYVGEIDTRLGAKESLTNVCADIAAKVSTPARVVTPGQVVMFVLMLVEQSRGNPPAQRPTGGFPVIQRTPPPVPVAAIANSTVAASLPPVLPNAPDPQPPQLGA